MGHGLRRRCREGVLAGRILLNYVVWGNGSVSARLWNAIRSDDWAIPHVSLSSLGEIVVWARPDEFPPRNMQTSKGLRALGYNVRIGVRSRRLWYTQADEPGAVHCLIRPPRCALPEQLTCINGAGERCTLTLEGCHGKRNILQSITRISLAGTAKRRDWRG